MKFKKFRYVFDANGSLLGDELLQVRPRLFVFLKLLVETEILPYVDTFGKVDRRLLLGKRPGGGFIFSVLAEPPLATDLEPWLHKHLPSPVHSFFWDPPVWVEKNLFKSGEVGQLRLEEVIFDKSLPNTGIRIAVTRDAEFHFDFTNFQKARKSPRVWKMDLPYSSEKTRIEKDLKIQRFQYQIKNCFIGLVCSGQRIQRRHACVMHCEGKHVRSSPKLFGRGGVKPQTPQRQ